MARMPEIIIDPVFDPRSERPSQAVRLTVRPELDSPTDDTFRLWMDNIPGIFFNKAQSSPRGYRFEPANEACEDPRFPNWVGTTSQAFWEYDVTKQFKPNDRLYDPLGWSDEMRKIAKLVIGDLPPDKKFEKLRKVQVWRDLPREVGDDSRNLVVSTNRQFAASGGDEIMLQQTLERRLRSQEGQSRVVWDVRPARGRHVARVILHDRFTDYQTEIVKEMIEYLTVSVVREWAEGPAQSLEMKRSKR